MQLHCSSLNDVTARTQITMSAAMRSRMNDITDTDAEKYHSISSYTATFAILFRFGGAEPTIQN